MKDRYKELFSELAGISLIDTHEHIPPENTELETERDIFDLFVPYVCDQFLSAGLKPDEWEKAMDKGLEFEHRWKIIEPLIPFVRKTTYFEAVERVLRRLEREAGMAPAVPDSLSLETAHKFSKMLSEKRAPGYYEKLFDSLHISKCLNFVEYDETDLFPGSQLLPVPTVSRIIPRNRREAARLESATGVSISSLPRLEQALEGLFDRYRKANIPAVKFGTAYDRRLDFGIPDKNAAEQTLEKALRIHPPGDVAVVGKPEPALRMEELLPLDDYLTHFMSAAAGDTGLPVVFHTGFHAWGGNRPERCHCEDLTGLVSSLPGTDFLLLHSGIPFIDEAINLAAYYPNVHLSMAWMHIIDRRKSVEAARRYIEALPLNKIHAYGGDYLFAENIAGHLEIALENLAEAVGEEVEAGRMTTTEAVETARLWLDENPKRFFSLD